MDERLLDEWYIMMETNLHQVDGRREIPSLLHPRNIPVDGMKKRRHRRMRQTAYRQLKAAIAHFDALWHGHEG